MLGFNAGTGQRPSPLLLVDRRRKLPCCSAALPGFEPELTDSESVVLPVTL